MELSDVKIILLRNKFINPDWLSCVVRTDIAIMGRQGIVNLATVLPIVRQSNDEKFKYLCGYHYPAQIISHIALLYHRFTLSFHDIEELL